MTSISEYQERNHSLISEINSVVCNEPVVNWKKFLWIDESKFNIFGTDGVIRVWRKVGESFRQGYIRKTVKHGGGSVVVWDSMAGNGLEMLHFKDRIINKDVFYCYIPNLL